MRFLPPALAAAAALALVCDAHAANDAGASTFESASRRYPVHVLRDEDIPVPAVTPKPPPTVPDYGPGGGEVAFEIKKFEVVGNTLLTPSEVDEVLAPFVGTGKHVTDVQAARDALQKAYEQDSFLTIAVTIPQQTIASGTVRLEVIEARIGNVAVQNEGVHWFKDSLVLRDTPHLQPGAILRRDDLEADMVRANANPDRHVRPVLRAGSEPGTVDVGLDVDDRIPLHGSVTLHNDHAPGSPEYRTITELRYGNLWGLEHEASVAYQFSPFKDFREVQIWAGTYRAPMPWDPGQSLFYYIAYSSTANGVTAAPDLSVLGNGVNMGARYRIELPTFEALAGFSHAFVVGVDRKDVQNTVAATGASIVTPIKYLPVSFEYDASEVGDQALTSLQLGFNFNRNGTIQGDSRNDFRANRGGTVPNNPVNGNYEVWTFGLQHALRLPAVMRTLAAGRFVSLPKPDRGMYDDWTFSVNARGQIATQPLISTEQMAAGGMDSVRGYLQSELFGDEGWNTQFELRAPALHGFLGGYAHESAQLVAFYDAARLFTKEAGEGQDPWATLQGYGLGLRGQLFGRVTGEIFVARPRNTTADTDAENTRYQFRLSAGF
ncbi:MAG TPA: ShlB/FhaC/HecB family hemolysin secretion/activation protein [Myxococcota bacterium]|jgi:hemolysin activation/secretion protein|nr:ShlB/FhaC/HecB family hemolysin secretion/activation protein [Myxococcota bacterium]